MILLFFLSLHGWHLWDGAVESVLAKYCHVGRENPSRVFSTKVDEKLVLLSSLGVQKRLLHTILNLPESLVQRFSRNLELLVLKLTITFRAWQIFFFLFFLFFIGDHNDVTFLIISRS